MSRLYTLGLDIGVASVGWSILENDPITEEPIKIIKLGVRTFKINEVSDTGESTAKARREKRGLRRRTRRRELRMKTARDILEKNLKVCITEELSKIANKDVYELRARALDERLSDAELCKVVLNLFKRRGFKSNRKGLADKESGLLLSAINQNQEFLEKKESNTFYHDGEIAPVAEIKDRNVNFSGSPKVLYLDDNQRKILSTPISKDNVKNYSNEDLILLLKNYLSAYDYENVILIQEELNSRHIDFWHEICEEDFL